MHERLKIVIVGGNRVAAQLIADFVSRTFVEVVAVADMFDDSPGAFAAQQLGITFTNNVAELTALAPDADLVIDMAEWPGVENQLRSAYPGAAGGNPTVIHDASARLMLSLAADSQGPSPLGAANLVVADC